MFQVHIENLLSPTVLIFPVKCTQEEETLTHTHLLLAKECLVGVSRPAQNALQKPVYPHPPPAEVSSHADTSKLGVSRANGTEFFLAVWTSGEIQPHGAKMTPLKVGKRRALCPSETHTVLAGKGWTRAVLSGRA